MTYYVLAPNHMYPSRTLWRIDTSLLEHDTELMQDSNDPGQHQFFIDIVAGLRLTGVCEPGDTVAT